MHATSLAEERKKKKKKKEYSRDGRVVLMIPRATAIIGVGLGIISLDLLEHRDSRRWFLINFPAGPRCDADVNKKKKKKKRKRKKKKKEREKKPIRDRTFDASGTF